MKEQYCPICYEKLEVRDVTPCEDCGALQNELNHYKSHDFNEYEVFDGLNLILCNFCDVDFGSYSPTYFGLDRKQRIGYDKMKFVRQIFDIRISKDKYCNNCGRRLSFLRFVSKAREKFGNE